MLDSRKWNFIGEAVMGTENIDSIGLMTEHRVVANGPLPAGKRAAHERELRNISFLSHDLNNNLNAITLQLKVLRQRLAEINGLSDELSMLDGAQNAILHTTEGMQRLLTHARLRRRNPQLHMRLVRLLEVANVVARQSALPAKLKGLDVAVDVPSNALVQSDFDLIVLVLQNLVGNSVKYSQRGSVTISARQEGPGCWTMFVSDQGDGIAPQKLERIFETFHCADAAGRGGLGLGLAIASEAARLLGAKLSARSTVGVGSSFGLTLNRHARVIAASSGELPGLEQVRRDKGVSESSKKGANYGTASKSRTWPDGGSLHAVP